MKTSWFVKSWIALSALGLLQCADRNRDVQSPPQSSMTPASGTVSPSATESSMRAGPTWAESESSMSPAPSAAPGSTQADTSATALEDSQIVGILLGINRAEVEQARIAQQKASNERVREFADMMIKDHSGARDKVDQLSRTMGFSSAESPLSLQLQASAKSALSKINSAAGADFDSTYMAEQISMHQQALDTIDKHLLRHARASELQSLIIETRPVIEQHLNEAKQIQQALASGGSEPSPPTTP